MNGDPLREGKLDLPELLEVPTPVEWAWAREFVARRRWREAVTYRETAPHEYVVRDWETDEPGNHDFDRFIALIRRFGYADFYYRVRHIYWAMSSRLKMPCGSPTKSSDAPESAAWPKVRRFGARHVFVNSPIGRGELPTPSRPSRRSCGFCC